MKKTLIESFALGTAGVVLCLGCQSGVPGGSGMSTPPIAAKTPAFEHATELETYLTSVCGFMLEPPNDAKFGYTRVQPMGIHATRTDQVKGYAEVEKLTSEFAIRTFVIGTKRPQPNLSKTPGARFTIPPNPKLDASTVSMNEVLADESNYFSTNLMQVKNPQPYEPDLVDAVLNLKPILDAKNPDIYVQPIMVGGVKGNLMVKAVRPPDKACLACHGNIKPGQPIGYAIATIWKKKT
ncbi:MAG: hypothetical protein WCG75_10765 [Armatimonadota bacterium]